MKYKAYCACTYIIFFPSNLLNLPSLPFLSRLSTYTYSLSHSPDVQGKLQVMLEDKCLGRLRTKCKLESSFPIFNEALTCVVPKNQIQMAVVQVTLFNEHKTAVTRELGGIVLSSKGIGEEYRHWNDVLAQPGKHIAEWHELRQR